jgi:hypothetical protein
MGEECNMKYVTVHLEDGTIIIHHSVTSVQVYTEVVILNRAWDHKRYYNVARLMVREQGRRLDS